MEQERAAAVMLRTQIRCERPAIIMSRQAGTQGPPVLRLGYVWACHLCKLLLYANMDPLPHDVVPYDCKSLHAVCWLAPSDVRVTMAWTDCCIFAGYDA